MKISISILVLLVGICVWQNATIAVNQAQIKEQQEIITYQLDKQEKAINKLLTPLQKQQLRAERILESLNDTTSKNKSIKMEVDDVR